MSEDTPEDIAARLEYLRGEIQAERISYGEISELQALAAHIPAWDVELLEWAGVPEFPEDAPGDAEGFSHCVNCGLAGMPLTEDGYCPPCKAAYAPGDAPVTKGGALESTAPRVPNPFPREYKGWIINAPNVHGLYTATNYSGGYGQVAADSLQGVKRCINHEIANPR